MLYIIICLIAGFAGGAVASAKGRSSLGWFILCFILPIAIVVLLFLKEAGAVSGVTQQCPHCAEIIKWEAKVCPHCQRDLVSAEPETV